MKKIKIMMRKGVFMLAAALFCLTACHQTGKAGGNPAPAETAEAAPANQYTDIALPGPQGHIMKVSNYVGKSKLVLIDFWASWCGPCRMEMPTVVKAYERFHDKGLEIVGVSLDNNRENWLEAIDALGQKWPQMSDLDGWNCEGARLYGIRSIPANVLINEQGSIIATNLRGEDLLSTLAKELGED